MSWSRWRPDSEQPWDVRRVVVTHGVVLQQSAKRVLRQAFDFLPEEIPGE